MDVIRKSTHKNPTTPAFKKLKLSAAEVDRRLFLLGLNKGNITVSHDCEKNEIRVSVSGSEDYDNLPIQLKTITEDPNLSKFFGSRRHVNTKITDGMTFHIPELSTAMADANHRMWTSGTRRIETFYELVIAIMGTLHIPGEMTAGTYIDRDTIYTGFFNIKTGSVAEARIKKAIDQAVAYIEAVLPAN